MKKRDYSTSYCADGAVYYETFVLALQHHPEYNYSLVIWKSTDGTFDYRAGNDLSAAQITGKIKQANAKANAIIPRIIRDGMTRKQKLRAIHNYLVKNCVYDENARRYGYDDAYTAYGCLIEKRRYVRAMQVFLTCLPQKPASVRSPFRVKPVADHMRGIM